MLITNIITLIFGFEYGNPLPLRLFLEVDCLYNPHIVACHTARNILLMNSSITINPNDSAMFKPLFVTDFISNIAKSCKPKTILDNKYNHNFIYFTRKTCYKIKIKKYLRRIKGIFKFNKIIIVNTQI